MTHKSLLPFTHEEIKAIKLQLLFDDLRRQNDFGQNIKGQQR
jgi:hypothetical protein